MCLGSGIGPSASDAAGRYPLGTNTRLRLTGTLTTQRCTLGNWSGCDCVFCPCDGPGEREMPSGDWLCMECLRYCGSDMGDGQW